MQEMYTVSRSAMQTPSMPCYPACCRRGCFLLMQKVGDPLRLLRARMLRNSSRVLAGGQDRSGIPCELRLTWGDAVELACKPVNAVLVGG